MPAPRTRFMAQDILTRTWLDLDIPITLDQDSPTWELSGPGSLTGRIVGDDPWLRDSRGDLILREWATALYMARGDRIVWGGIVQASRFDGPDWTVEAHGYTSYADDYPYTGDYRKFVDADPGVVWNALWAHIQSQPDGNLGLRLTTPLECGPNVGTKDEPYELSWWEAKDCGDELHGLAAEAPFDYVETHEWSTGAAPQSTVTASSASWSVGEGNLYGGYDSSDKGWMKKRAAGQADLIGSMKVDLFVANECHEQTSSAMPNGAHRWFEGVLQKRVGPGWKLYPSEGGNQLYVIDGSRFSVLQTVIAPRQPDPLTPSETLRSAATYWQVRDGQTGQTAWVCGYHTHADDDTGSRESVRQAETTAMIQTITSNGYSPIFGMGDANDWGEDAGDVYGRLRAALGWQSLKYRGPVTNADYDSDTHGKHGRWIDNILTSPAQFDVSEAEGIPTRGLSDHQLWTRCRITFRVNAGVVGVTSGRGVTHRLIVGYPRLGRRRTDLSFIQGDNITETVPVTRDGALYANTVIVLGKGEGSKTVRGEDPARDGRLRRPYVYADKLVGTTKRANAIAARERGWRQLGLDIASIVVADHPNAPLASWELGDDIYVQAKLPHLGWVRDWYRVVAWSFRTETTAALQLVRSDSYRYAPGGSQ